MASQFARMVFFLNSQKISARPPSAVIILSGKDIPLFSEATNNLLPALSEKKTVSNPAFQENQTVAGTQKTVFCPLKRSYPDVRSGYILSYAEPPLILHLIPYYSTCNIFHYLVEYKKNGETKKTTKTTA